MGRVVLAVATVVVACAAQAADGPPAVIEVRVERSRDRQVIDGFGGSLAYWGQPPDAESLRQAFQEMGATIVRVPAEVAHVGEPDVYRDVLRRVSEVAPDAKVYLTFWQPRSLEKRKAEDWLDSDAEGKYRLKPAMTAAWAEEIASRVHAFRADGANVVAVGVQNEPNFSVPGSLTCAWDPGRLADFTALELAPRLAGAGEGLLPLGAPDLAYIGHEASEAKRFAPVLAGPGATIFTYHMYDSYKEGTPNPGFDGLRARQKALGTFLKESLPTKRVWMTETTGAQWNGPEWHTLGWEPSFDEHDKTIAAARYMHSVLVDAGANAFLWWGLIYSAPPASKEQPEERQKFRDEGLILVEPEVTDGSHRFLERTPKSYAFQQFAKFVRPGWVRLDVWDPSEGGGPLVAAFRDPAGREVAVVLINPDKAAAKPVAVNVAGDSALQLRHASVTDRERRCEAVEWAGSLPAGSVVTLMYEAE